MSENFKSQCCFKQGKTPICAIYSFLNGLFYGRKIIFSCKLKKVVTELWKYALESKSSNITTELDSHNTSSLVGEFFNTESLIFFLKSVLNESKLEKFHSLLNSIGLDSDNIKIRCIDSVAEFDRELTRSFENVFYIVPINADNTCKNNMHWICIRKNRILNSGNFDYLRRATEWPNNGERHNTLIKRSFSRAEIVTMFEGIHIREKGLQFDFHNWAEEERCKLKKEYPCEYQKRVEKISEISPCDYYFKYSDFNVIRVEVDKK